VEIFLPVLSVKLVLCVPSQTFSGLKTYENSKRRLFRIDSVHNIISKHSKIRKAVKFEASASDYSDNGESEEESEPEGIEDDDQNRFADYEIKKRSSTSDLQAQSYVRLYPDKGTIKNCFHKIVSSLECAVGKVLPLLQEPQLKVLCSPPEVDLKLNYDENQLEDEGDDEIFHCPYIL